MIYLRRRFIVVVISKVGRLSKGKKIKRRRRIRGK